MIIPTRSSGEARLWNNLEWVARRKELLKKNSLGVARASAKNQKSARKMVGLYE